MQAVRFRPRKSTEWNKPAIAVNVATDSTFRYAERTIFYLGQLVGMLAVRVLSETETCVARDCDIHEKALNHRSTCP